ncbi:MAG: hypothetical protein HOM55_11165 [Proteobacteria bacterium]|nr:hypothetical protein [Pseudomonadota bacterium]
MARIVKIALGLVVLNLMLFLWPEADKQTSPADPEINASQLKLLSELQAPEDKFVAVIGSSDQGSGDQGPEGQDSAESVKDSSCYKVGPFVAINELTMARARLDQLQIPFSLGQVGPRSTTVIRLFMGPFESRVPAETAQAALREKGLMDHFLKPDGDAWLLSIGVFVDRVRAEQRLALLNRRDPDIKLRVEYGDIPPGSWVIVETASITKGNEAQLLGIPWHESGVELSVSPCNAPLVSVSAAEPTD